MRHDNNFPIIEMLTAAALLALFGTILFATGCGHAASSPAGVARPPFALPGPGSVSPTAVPPQASPTPDSGCDGSSDHGSRGHDNDD